eukprot:1159183-Pelagomonas_calceolata.AAC.38
MQQGEGSCQALVPGVAPSGFSSFPAQAFFSSQENEEKERHQKLLEAAKAHLSSSSDESSSSSEGKEESRGKRKRAERHGKSHSSKKRRKKEEGSPGKHKKRKHKQTDLEKILAKEQQAAEAAMAGRGGLRPGVQAPSTQWADRQAMSKSVLGASYYDTKGDVQNLAYMVGVCLQRRFAGGCFLRSFVLISVSDGALGSLGLWVALGAPHGHRGPSTQSLQLGTGS